MFDMAGDKQIGLTQVMKVVGRLDKFQVEVLPIKNNNYKFKKKKEKHELIVHPFATACQAISQKQTI